MTRLALTHHITLIARAKPEDWMDLIRDLQAHPKRGARRGGPVYTQTLRVFTGKVRGGEREYVLSAGGTSWTV